MSEDPMRAKARATFGKGFMDAAKPKPAAKNAAVASQKVANSRPIPTYKDGGSVTAERVAARMAAGNYAGGGKIQTSADTARKLATEMGGMTPVKKAVGGTGKTRKGMAPIKRAEGGVAKKRPMPGEASNYQELKKGRFSWDTEGLMEGGGPRSDKSIRGASDLNRMAGNEDSAYGRAIQARQKNIEGHNAMTARTMRDIKLSQLKTAAEKPGASRYAKDRYRMARQSGMYAEGGVAKKRDTMPREPISTRPTTPDGRRITIEELNASNKPEPAPKPKPPKPVRRAKGGAGKVRKGMMTQEGNIKQAVKPKKGIGGYM